MTKKLIVRLPNWVGDVIMALPAIDNLTKHYSELILIGKPWLKDLLKGLNLPIHSYPKHWSAGIKLYQSIDATDVLLFPNSFSSALVAKLAGKNTFGYKHEGRGFLLSAGFIKPNIAHDSNIFFNLTEQFINSKQQVSVSHLPPKLPINQDSLNQAKLRLRQEKIESSYVILCPFAHGLTKDKQSKIWPFWQELVEKLQGVNCIICPGPQEVAEARIKFATATILDDVKLDEYAALMTNAKLVIANDSGPMHMAAAVGAPTIALFGRTDPEKVAPGNAVVLGNKSHWPSLEEALSAIINRL